MRAVRLHAPGEALRVEDVPVPEPAGTEVRIRVAGAGVCHTDLHIVDGVQTRVELPRTLGHEVAGWIDAVGPEADRELRRMRLRPGDGVVVHGGWGCGECRECLGGAEQRCERSRAPGFQADGGYAEAVLVPHPRHLVGLGRLDPVRAAPLADAGITPYRAIRRAERWLTPAGRVLVIGCGALGQFALQLLRLVPDDGRDLFVVVRELSPARLERAAALGADVGLLDGEPDMSLEASGDRRTSSSTSSAPTPRLPTRPRSWRPTGWWCSSGRPAARSRSDSTRCPLSRGSPRSRGARGTTCARSSVSLSEVAFAGRSRPCRSSRRPRRMSGCGPPTSTVASCSFPSRLPRMPGYRAHSPKMRPKMLLRSRRRT